MILKRILQFPLRVWHRFITPMVPPMCRFYPSCSVYAVEALDKHRMGTALWLIIRRVGRCHPFHPGGYDPVPERGGGPVSGDPECDHSGR